MYIVRRFLAAIEHARAADCVLVSLTLALIPGFYWAEVVHVLPMLHEKWSFWYTFHFAMSLFMLHNIAGNLARGMAGPGATRRRTDDNNANDGRSAGPDWRYCERCDEMSPPRSWHCAICRACIFKRDHHCNFFGCCVGYFNYRYFFMFVAHVFFAMCYALLVNVAFFRRFIELSLLNWLSLFTFLFPLASLAIEWSPQNAYVVLLAVNAVFALFTAYLFFYHVRLLIRGRTVGEAKHRVVEYDAGWRRNVVDALGKRWYLVWATPFAPSPLPGDGMHWKKADL